VTRAACAFLLLFALGPGCARERVADEAPGTTRPAARPEPEWPDDIARWSDADPPVPDLAPAEQSFLLDLAHRTLAEYLKTGRVYQPEHEPPGLAAKRGRLFLVVRCRWERWALTQAGPGGLPELVRLATIEAAGSRPFRQHLRAAARSPDGPPRPGDWTFILHVAGPRQFIPGDSVADIRRAVVAGVHGLGVRGRRREGEVFPADAVAHGADVPDILEQLDRRAGLRRDPLSRNGRGVYFYRFRTCAFGDGHRLDELAPYVRGVRLIDQAEVTHRSLLDAAVLGADYLIRNQHDDGRLPARYDPREGKGSRDGGAHAAAVASLGLARMAILTQRADATAAARQALAALVRRHAAKPDSRDAAPTIFIKDADRPLGATASTVTALQTLGALGRLGGLADSADTLGRAIGTHLGPDQRFRGPFEKSAPDEVAAAVQALAADRGSVEAAARVWTAYERAFGRLRDPADVAQFVLASAALYQAAPDPQYAEAVLKGAEHLAAYQYRPGAKAPPYPDCLGAWPGRDGSAEGLASAAVVEALAAACVVAVKEREPRAADTYRRALAYGCRYLLQLHCRPEDAWLARKPEDALGGFRASLTDHTIDGALVGRALTALVAVLRAVPAAQVDRFASPEAPTIKEPGPAPTTNDE